MFVNEILGSCRHGNNCTFEYSAEKTPNLTSISPSSGPGGTVITILGSGFSTVNEENSVQIGGITCVVLSSTSDDITCRAGKRFEVLSYLRTQIYLLHSPSPPNSSFDWFVSFFVLIVIDQSFNLFDFSFVFLFRFRSRSRRESPG